VYRRVLVTNNGQFALSGGGAWHVIEDSELSWNNVANYRRTNETGPRCGDYWGAGAAKFVLSVGTPTDPGLKIVNLESHHNVGDGLWTDIRNQYVLVQRGHFHDNERFGYFHEIGCDIELTANELDHNGAPIKNTDVTGGGVMILDSNNANVHDNRAHDNSGYGIVLGWQPHNGLRGSPCLVAQSDTDVSNAGRNNVIANNDVYMCSGRSGGRGATLLSRNNQFLGNRYHVPDAVGTWWLDQSPVTWANWQAAGHDLAGSRVTSCTFP
jgi:hypothetical protein